MCCFIHIQFLTILSSTHFRFISIAPFIININKCRKIANKLNVTVVREKLPKKIIQIILIT